MNWRKEKEDFLNDLLTIDFAQIQKLYEASKKVKDFSKAKIEPIDFVDKSKLSKEEYAKYEKIGTEKNKSLLCEKADAMLEVQESAGRLDAEMEQFKNWLFKNK